MKQLILSMAAIFLLPANALAVGIEVGVPGVAGGSRGESREDRRNHERLERDIRSIRMAQRHLEKLGRQEVPEKLEEQAREEWQRQSVWLKKQAETLDDLAGDMDRYLGLGGGSGQFDYQQARMESFRILGNMKGKAEDYSVKGKAAVKRQEKAIRAIAHAD